jgi:hypothetical protein
MRTGVLHTLSTVAVDSLSFGGGTLSGFPVLGSSLTVR